MHLVNQEDVRNRAYPRALEGIIDRLRVELSEEQLGPSVTEQLPGGTEEKDRRRFVYMTDTIEGAWSRQMLHQYEGEWDSRVEAVRDELEEALQRYDPETEGVVVWLPGSGIEDLVTERLQSKIEDFKATEPGSEPAAVVAIFELAEELR